MARSERWVLWIDERLGKEMRTRAVRLGIGSKTYAYRMLSKAVDRDLRGDITATEILDSLEKRPRSVGEEKKD